SIGTRVGLTLLLRALVPLNFWRVQNVTAARPSGTPAVVTPRLEGISSPQTGGGTGRPLTNASGPMPARGPRGERDAAVSCTARAVRGVAAQRAVVAAKCPARMTASSTRGFLKKR